MVTKTTKSKKYSVSFECKYCKDSFSSERVMINHLCMKKRRFIDRDTETSQLGLKLFQKFYEKCMKASPIPTLFTFIDSRNYLAFIRFARYYKILTPVGGEKFFDYLLDNGISINDWDKKYVYHRYVKEYLLKEPIKLALERTIINIAKYCEHNDIEMKEYFDMIPEFMLVNDIMHGKISPWVLLVSEQGKTFFKSFRASNINDIQDVMPIERWVKKIESSDNKDKVELVKKALEMGGLS